ncbi:MULTISPECIES: DUF1488 domain-containing protein [Pseudoalteromonas]|jgi:hypothetical protein|uniref:DUF1488 domain-containing protein n=1 Tax=Pseudoalteromonas lipolytica TaxID=570156 RepID=A0AAD0WBC3_9GAMM|nr:MULTISPECIES: DUF1488 domain-containing protein [Pseudoalteromonas]MAE01178.1 DUF1488 domain-containing protein [Pseudoalteromonas sp.]AXV63846.1 DUF1488 domain-containing protein [Pseudoalteromonas donghaensis]EWH04509.1 membrane protein [Pseudoalteromonas lipolytica SCSIO 04301]MBE0352504.1 hypothetical protein [Pseudoalteromonas lipolytica LMEB 39]MCC9662640.1 DUF1488 domain-containing protein [Pseudoalteromonas sp. MB41]|tara:strand:+ start:8133 stop:8387 length:255 start_codon:yes stop_codon:yes gene_type:complete
MNQAIQFIDRVEYKAQDKLLVFYAQVSGMMVECVIDTDKYDFADQSGAINYFETHRFDYEELAEQLIEDEQYNSAGQIVLTEVF